MYNFASDYLEGAHPQVLEALHQTNAVYLLKKSNDGKISTKVLATFLVLTLHLFYYNMGHDIQLIYF